MRIQHNIMAMNAYRNLSVNNSGLSKNLEKLASGYRINRAGDDAAGLAISEKMRAQIAGLDQAQKNAQSGINLVQTAEGALTEVHDMLNRMTTLATQAANGTYENTDRDKLQAEVNALIEEIDRIADNSNFNGTKLLDGGLDGASKTTVNETLSAAGLNSVNAAVEGNDGEAGSFTIDISQLEIKTTSSGTETVTFEIGTFSFSVTVDSTATVTAGAIHSALGTALSAGTVTFAGADASVFELKANQDGKITFTMVSAPTTNAADALKSTYDFKINVGSGMATSNKGSSVAGTDVTQAVEKTDGVYASSKFSLGSIDDGSVVQLGDNKYLFAVGKESKYADGKDGYTLVDLTEFETTDTDFAKQAAAALTVAAKNDDTVIVSYDESGNIDITEKKGKLDHDTYIDDTTKEIKNDFVKIGSFSESTETGSGRSLTLQIGASAQETIKVGVKSMKADSLGIKGLKIGTDAEANAAIDTIKKAIETVSTTRGDLGAVQNRLEHTINNLGVMEENIQDAEANIRDTDVADEMMAYTKNNILIQSAQAMLAQANQTPQGVLQLMQ